MSFSEVRPPEAAKPGSSRTRQVVWGVLEVIGAVLWALCVALGCLVYLLSIALGSLTMSDAPLVGLLCAAVVLGVMPIILLIWLRPKVNESGTFTMPRMLLRAFLLLVITGVLVTAGIAAVTSGQGFNVGRFDKIEGRVMNSNMSNNDGTENEVEGYVYFEDLLTNFSARPYIFHNFVNQTLAPGKNLMLYVRDGDLISKSLFSSTLTLTRGTEVSRWTFNP